jgi:tRNA-2-methylthio-N6-dimethylallyladenosine synthase
MSFLLNVAALNAEFQIRTGRRRAFCITTFGCQMNEHDSEKIAGLLIEAGYEESPDPENCDLLIFNTCCVRGNAEEKLFGRLGAVKNTKKRNPGMIVAVCGCMMQEPEMVRIIKAKYRHADLVFGTFNLSALPELLYRKLIGEKRVIEVLDEGVVTAECLPMDRKDKIKALVTIMQGCDNFCAYCVVPYVRGRQKSRPAAQILSEVRELAAAGYKEIMLLGQNVNSYGLDAGGETTFAQLLRAVSVIDGLERIRFMTSHPKDLTDDIISVMAECPRICRQLHLPIQSGSDDVLLRMNRRYTRDDYLALVNRIRLAMPGIGLTTDIIVGFPGETERDFRDTLDLMRDVKFDSAYTFLYSKRNGTPAAEDNRQVSEEVAHERFDRLIEH